MVGCKRLDATILIIRILRPKTTLNRHPYCWNHFSKCLAPRVPGPRVGPGRNFFHPPWSIESIAKDPMSLSLLSSQRPASQIESISAFCIYINKNYINWHYSNLLAWISHQIPLPLSSISVERKCSEVGTSLVIGGDKVVNRQYPWAGAAFYNKSFYCGGNLSNYKRQIIFRKKY
jgi:hypothetical protein